MPTIVVPPRPPTERLARHSQAEPDTARHWHSEAQPGTSPARHGQAQPGTARHHLRCQRQTAFALRAGDHPGRPGPALAVVPVIVMIVIVVNIVIMLIVLILVIVVIIVILVNKGTARHSQAQSGTAGRQKVTKSNSRASKCCASESEA